MAATLLCECLAAGIAGATADGLYNPATVLMVRGQLAPGRSTGALARDAVARDGIVGGLWRPGLSAICLRALTYSGARVGLYPTVRDSMPVGGFAARLLAGCMTGALGAAAFMPTEVVRVRAVAACGQGHRATASSTARAVLREESLRGLWRGAAPFALRCGCFSGAQLATYETAKRRALSLGLVAREGPGQHLLASLASGVCAQVVCHPIDTVKTVAIMQGPGSARGALAVGREALAGGGVRRLYAGLLLAVVSRGPMVMTFLPLVELLRTRVFGLGYI